MPYKHIFVHFPRYFFHCRKFHGYTTLKDYYEMESCMLHLHKVGETENVYICMYFMYKGEVQNSF